jgi:hypothetical protein
MNTAFNLRKTAMVALCALALAPGALFAGQAAKVSVDHGVIKSVDATAHQLVVTDSKTKIDETFQWNDQTKFTEHDKAVTASALHPGMPVNVKFTPGAGTPTMKSVHLWPAKEQQHAAHHRR